MKNFKKGYKQASFEIYIGLSPVIYWSLNPFWIGYNLALLGKILADNRNSILFCYCCFCWFVFGIWFNILMDSL